GQRLRNGEGGGSLVADSLLDLGPVVLILLRRGVTGAVRDALTHQQRQHPFHAEFLHVRLIEKAAPPQNAGSILLKKLEKAVAPMQLDLFLALTPKRRIE